jgi:hypothetical protein
MKRYCGKIGLILALVLITAAAVTTTTFSFEKVQGAMSTPTGCCTTDPTGKAPIATAGDNNVYVAWWSNKTGNDEVMFKASTDGGKTFSNKMNLSNSPNSDSQDAEIAAAGNNVYVSWWERNQTMNEPVLRVSNDNGKTFGEKIMLSAAK